MLKKSKMYGGGENKQTSIYQQQYSVSRDPRLSGYRNSQQTSEPGVSSLSSISQQRRIQLPQQPHENASFLPTELLSKTYPSHAGFQQSFPTACYPDSLNNDADVRNCAVAQTIPRQPSAHSAAVSSSYTLHGVVSNTGYQQQAFADFPSTSYAIQSLSNTLTESAVRKSNSTDGGRDDLRNLLDRLAQYSTTYQFAVDTGEKESTDKFEDEDCGDSQLFSSGTAGVQCSASEYPSYEELQHQKEEKFRQMESQFGRGVMKSESRDPFKSHEGRLSTHNPQILTAKVAPIPMAVPPKYHAPDTDSDFTLKVAPSNIQERPPTAASSSISPAQIQSLVPNEKVRELLNAMGVSDQALIQKLTSSVQQRLYDSAQSLQQPATASIPPPTVLSSIPPPMSFHVKSSAASASNYRSSREEDERKRASNESRKRKSSSPVNKKSSSSKKSHRHRSASDSSSSRDSSSARPSVASDEETEDFLENAEKKQWRVFEKLMKKGRKMSAEDRQLLEKEVKKIESSLGVKRKLLTTQETRFSLLQDEMNHLRRQHNTMCRRLQRQKHAGATDPLMFENEQLQAEMERQIDAIEKSKTELNEEVGKLQKRKEKLSKALGLKVANKKDQKYSESSEEKLKESDCEYFDAGSHWCRCCNLTFATFQDFLNHLHTLQHTENSADSKTGTPWRPDRLKYGIRDGMNGTKSIVKPFRGAEFMLPMIGFYCHLCQEMSGDSVCAEDHVRSLKHNAAYQKYIKDNPYYEQRFNLDRTAAATLLKRPSLADSKPVAASSIAFNVKEEEKNRRESQISSLDPKKDDDKGVRMANAINRFYSGRATADDRQLLDDSGWKPPGSKKTPILPAWIPGLKAEVRSYPASSDTSSGRDYNGKYDRDRRRSRSRDRDDRGRDRIELSKYN